MGLIGVQQTLRRGGVPWYHRKYTKAGFVLDYYTMFARTKTFVLRWRDDEQELDDTRLYARFGLCQDVLGRNGIRSWICTDANDELFLMVGELPKKKVENWHLAQPRR